MPAMVIAMRLQADVSVVSVTSVEPTRCPPGFSTRLISCNTVDLSLIMRSPVEAECAVHAAVRERECAGVATQGMGAGIRLGQQSSLPARCALLDELGVGAPYLAVALAPEPSPGFRTA